jgi:ferredoxin|tara:strand:- start:1407 stop:1601 length:195 start_codon:yes stop_codon:yes gene_type:complete
MIISRVWIEEGCIFCGMSEANCPEAFQVKPGESAKVIPGVDYSDLEEKIKYAAGCCPVGVIKYS